MNDLRKPDAGEPHVRFDEGREVDGHWPGAFQSVASRLLYLRWIEVPRVPLTVNRVLGRELLLPARRPADLDTLLKDVPELRLLVLDGVERPVRRPKDKDDQKMNYSGKKVSETPSTS